MSEIGYLIGSNIRQVRKIRGLTMDELADIVSDQYGIILSAALIGAWERGERRISAEYLYMIAQALGCSVHTLLGISSDIRVEAGLLSEHEVAIIEYLFNQWSGDTHALIDFIGMYMAGDKETRHNMSQSALSIFRAARNHGMKVNVPYNIRVEYLNKKTMQLQQ